MTTPEALPRPSYQKFAVEVRATQGAAENLTLLRQTSSGVDLGFGLGVSWKIRDEIRARVERLVIRKGRARRASLDGDGAHIDAGAGEREGELRPAGPGLSQRSVTFFAAGLCCAADVLPAPVHNDVTSVPLTIRRETTIMSLFARRVRGLLLGFAALFAGAALAQETPTQAPPGVKLIEVEVSGPGSGRESALRALQAGGFTVTSIRDVTPIAHNGCRPRKRRRV